MLTVLALAERLFSKFCDHFRLEVRCDASDVGVDFVRGGERELPRSDLAAESRESFAFALAALVGAFGETLPPGDKREDISKKRGVADFC